MTDQPWEEHIIETLDELFLEDLNLPTCDLEGNPIEDFFTYEEDGECD